MEKLESTRTQELRDKQDRMIVASFIGAISTVAFFGDALRATSEINTSLSIGATVATGIATALFVLKTVLLQRDIRRENTEQPPLV